MAMQRPHKDYDMSFRDKRRLKYERCKRAAGRVEQYTFKGSRSSVSLSRELKGNLSLKSDMYIRSESESLWDDRSSRIAAPFGAELFLQNEKSALILGCPRYYFNDFLVQDREPNARSRFPYDEVAHTASKTITRLFRRNLDRKNRAATIIQRNVRTYVEMQILRAEAKLYNESISMVQKTFRKNRETFRRNSVLRRERKNEMNRCIQEREEARLKEEREAARLAQVNLAFLAITRMAKRYLKRKRKARGIAKRELNYARRVQANYRGRQERKRLKKIYDARIYVMYWWRKYWRRKYSPYAITIQRAYRNYILRKAVIMVQRKVRLFQSRHHKNRKRLEIIANERSRASRECIVLTRRLNEASKDLKWKNDDEQVPPISLEDHMRRVDVFCLAVLCANPLQKAKGEYKTIHPEEFGEDEFAAESERLLGEEEDTLERRIVKAVLNLFCNRPGGCIDYASLSICQEYLKPSKEGGLPQEAWDNMTSLPMVNIHSLVEVLEPSRSLLSRVKIQGKGRYLPRDILAKSVIVHRWTMHFDWVLRKYITQFRKQFPPRRVCIYCHQPMMFDGEVHDHRRCCRNGFPSWMIKDLDPIVNVLKEQCLKLKIPHMPRPFAKDEEKLYDAQLDLKTPDVTRARSLSISRSKSISVKSAKMSKSRSGPVPMNIRVTSNVSDSGRSGKVSSPIIKSKSSASEKLKSMNSVSHALKSKSSTPEKLASISNVSEKLKTASSSEKIKNTRSGVSTKLK